MRDADAELGGELFFGTVAIDVELQEVVFPEREDPRAFVGEGDGVLEMRR
jgi:hypothetical protein